MDYIPNTDRDRKFMLSSLGIGSLGELFADIPRDARLKHDIPLPAAASESELVSELAALSDKNSVPAKMASFLGGGVYNHFIPSVVKHIASRSEFYTSYTPYQPEISQGMLQVIYEYQSMICSLTGMDVANASMYDGATVLAEAAALSVRHTGRREILVLSSTHPNYREVLKTYGNFGGWQPKEFPFLSSGSLDIEAVKRSLGEKTAALIISQPNFFGCVEDISGLAEAAHCAGALLIVSVDPISLGLLALPGNYGADIVVGEGLSLGSSPSFGGPGLGIFAVKKDLMRLLPGRVVGETTDTQGRRGFVLTLQTREQHIRRERATSNICSNEALNALQAVVYLSYMGKQGLRKAAELCLRKAAYAKEKISKIKGYSVPFSSPTFKEFVIKCPRPVQKINKALFDDGIIGGLDLSAFYPKMKDHMLLSFTELSKKVDIDLLADKLGRIAK